MIVDEWQNIHQNPEGVIWFYVNAIRFNNLNVYGLGGVNVGVSVKVGVGVIVTGGVFVGVGGTVAVGVAMPVIK